MIATNMPSALGDRGEKFRELWLRSTTPFRSTSAIAPLLHWSEPTTKAVSPVDGLVSTIAVLKLLRFAVTKTQLPASGSKTLRPASSTTHAWWPPFSTCATACGREESVHRV